MSSLLLLCVIALKNTLQEKIPRMHYLTLQEEYMIFTTLMVVLSLLMSATQFTYSCATRTALDAHKDKGGDEGQDEGEGGGLSGWGWGGQCVYQSSSGTTDNDGLQSATFFTLSFAVCVYIVYHAWLTLRLHGIFSWAQLWKATRLARIPCESPKDTRKARTGGNEIVGSIFKNVDEYNGLPPIYSSSGVPEAHGLAVSFSGGPAIRRKQSLLLQPAAAPPRGPSVPGPSAPESLFGPSAPPDPRTSVASEVTKPKGPNIPKTSRGPNTARMPSVKTSLESVDAHSIAKTAGTCGGAPIEMNNAQIRGPPTPGIQPKRSVPGGGSTLENNGIAAAQSEQTGVDSLDK
jgi:hypothetical protein